MLVILLSEKGTNDDANSRERSDYQSTRFLVYGSVVMDVCVRHHSVVLPCRYANGLVCVEHLYTVSKEAVMKIMVVTTAGIYFAGPNNLVENPDEGMIFEDVNSMLDRLRDILTLCTLRITQVRILGKEYQ